MWFSLVNSRVNLISLETEITRHKQDELSCFLSFTNLQKGFDKLIFKHYHLVIISNDILIFKHHHLVITLDEILIFKHHRLIITSDVILIFKHHHLIIASDDILIFKHHNLFIMSDDDFTCHHQNQISFISTSYEYFILECYHHQNQIDHHIVAVIIPIST